jgi:xanthine dehydrogenase accessory factor
MSMAEDDTATLEQAAHWLEQGKKVALATVIETWGSSPRPPGSHFAMTPDGDLAGSVSGGCIEPTIAQEAVHVLAEGRPRRMDFAVADETAWQVGLSCGGSVSILLQVPTLAIVREALAAHALRRPVALAVALTDGREASIEASCATGTLDLDEAGLEAVRSLLVAERCGIIDSAAGQVFVRPYPPAWRMAIVGAVHIAQALAPMAAAAGFAVSVIDPRRAFATEARFPGLDLRDDWPDEALEHLGPDAHTAVVTLTHDPKLDDPALIGALRSPAFFVGSLGSRRTHEKRLARLREAGLLASDLGRIHGPVGLDIGARSPAEIAISIVAQVIAAKRRTISK